MGLVLVLVLVLDNLVLSLSLWVSPCYHSILITAKQHGIVFPFLSMLVTCTVYCHRLTFAVNIQLCLNVTPVQQHFCFAHCINPRTRNVAINNALPLKAAQSDAIERLHFLD